MSHFDTLGLPYARVTGSISPSVVHVLKDEGSMLCAADGWIDEGWEHVTGTLSKLSG